MLEDRLLLQKLKHGDADALRQIYEKYKHDLLGLAVTLSGDKTTGEDVMQDVFVSFVRAAPNLRLRIGLRSYLLTSVANGVRTLGKTGIRPLSRQQVTAEPAHPQTPDEAIVQNERAMLIERAMQDLPDDQREVIILHLQAGMKFREIARSQGLSINTVQSRYRYGLQKLRSSLDGKVTI